MTLYKETENDRFCLACHTALITRIGCGVTFLHKFASFATAYLCLTFLTCFLFIVGKQRNYFQRFNFRHSNRNSWYSFSDNFPLTAPVIAR